MSFRTGFIARGFLMLGPLTVSRGFGPGPGAVIQAPFEVETVEGAGRQTQINAFIPPGPKTTIRFPEK